MLVSELPTAKHKGIIPDQILYKLLSEGQYLEEKQLKTALEKATSQKKSLYDALIELDLVSDENLGKLYADFLKIPFISLTKVSIPDATLQIVPELVARKQKIIVFEKNKTGLKLATSNPENKDPIEFISKKSGEKVTVYFATERDLDNALALYKKQLASAFDELLKEQIEKADQGVSEVPIAKIVDLLITYAYDNKASDIHIEPAETQTSIRFRIDGVLHDVLSLPKKFHDQVISRIKVLAKLRTDEHLKAQDGKLQVNMEKEEIDVRVSIVPIVDGEKCVMRILSARSRQFSLSDLGINNEDLYKVKNGFEKPYGMVLATGPTGSGKTTTIYAVLKIINTREKNIATIEDPVEYEVEGINQIQVNPKTNLTFADGLRSILRQDPDVIFVGEIRDEETADIAINSAMTGHLVLSTLHTNDAATALPRLIDMKVEPFLVASTVNVIIAQRLVRKICDRCRVSLTIPRSELTKHIPENLIKKYLGVKKEVRGYHGKGCSVCHLTGYVGRVGIFEILEMTPKIKQLITSKADADIIKNMAIKEGMLTMLEDGLEKVINGVTTLEEILRVTKS